MPKPHTAEPFLQQALVGALLIGLVGDIGQVDPAECGAVVQNHIAHAEAQHIGLETLLQVVKEPAGRAKVKDSTTTDFCPHSDRPGHPLTSHWCS